MLGEAPKTTSFSNLGVVKMPDCFARHIKRFDFIPDPNPITKISCAAISFEDTLSITFGRLIQETELEKYFFRRLVSTGIPVKIETN
jgi:hypothetical protein